MPVAKEKRINIGFAVPESEYELWKRIAEAEHRSLAAEIRNAMAEKVQRTFKDWEGKPQEPALEEL